MMSTPMNTAKRVNLALQGGGAHGAFTWGVLDRLLEDGRIDIEGICGASAGALNATVLAYGHMHGANDGAREALHSFWRAVSDSSMIAVVRDFWVGKSTANTCRIYSIRLLRLEEHPIMRHVGFTT